MSDPWAVEAENLHWSYRRIEALKRQAQRPLSLETEELMMEEILVACLRKAA